MNNVDRPQNIISFCTGFGGLELGIHRAGVDIIPIVYLECEAYVQANLVAKMEKGEMASAPVWSDLKTFDATPFHGKVDGVIGGYPCTPFSSAGKRKGKKDPRHLWPFIRKHIQSIRPTWAFFENVHGHLSLGLSTVISDLEEDGYRVEAGIFSAEEVGAPHQRKRVFILGYSEHNGLPPNSVRRGSKETSHRSQEGKKETKQSSRTSRREDLSDLQRTELAHSKDSGGKSSKRKGREGSKRGSQDRGRDMEKGRDPFPARPGQKQHEWEEPRVVSTKCQLVRTNHGAKGGVDSIANRVDRLRMLGNGVVPQTAELAWRTLWGKMNESN